VQDIIEHIHEIVRSEVRLAKIETAEEFSKAKSSAILLAAGTAGGLLAALFLLLAIASALALRLPFWAAALIVGSSVALAASLSIGKGLRQLRQVHHAPQRTVASIKENLTWIKHQMK